MIYKPFQDLNLSRLGMGNMRLPTKEDGAIDRAKAREIIEYAYDHGVNYFDTAYRYHNGESELVVGEVLKQYPRSSFCLASKMPGHMMNYQDGRLGFQGYLSHLEVKSPADIFEEQLEKCGVDYFDFYLLHNVNESSIGFYMDEDLRIAEYLQSQKKAGRIRHLGFSTHGRPETIEKFLNWNSSFEFVQIQLNYLDWTLQQAGRKYELLTERGLPIIVMEPVRGGRLAALSEASTARLKAARPEASVASWAFRYLQALPNVQVVLSGMTTLEQLKDNLATFDTEQPLTDDERAVLAQVVDDLASLVPCTACRYCCEECPQGLDIPKLLALYNEMSYAAANDLPFHLIGAESAADCLACGSCQRICPQGIEIPEIMRKLAKA